MNIQALIAEAKSLRINDTRMIASWIYNTQGYKKIGFKQVKAMVEAQL